MLRRARYGLIPRLLFVASVTAPLCAQAQISAPDELRTMRAAPGFDVYLFASEPMITNPAAIDVDTHGRVWMTEIRGYRRGATSPPSDKTMARRLLVGSPAPDRTDQLWGIESI